jgi:hypothetical protein
MPAFFAADIDLQSLPINRRGIKRKTGKQCFYGAIVVSPARVNADCHVCPFDVCGAVG